MTTTRIYVVVPAAAANEALLAIARAGLTLRPIPAGPTQDRRYEVVTPEPEPRPELHVQLTDREHQVLLAIADGHSNPDIGRQMGVTEETVKCFARRLFQKLGATGGRAHAVSIAYRAGILGGAE